MDRKSQDHWYTREKHKDRFVKVFSLSIMLSTTYSDKKTDDWLESVTSFGLA